MQKSIYHTPGQTTFLDTHGFKNVIGQKGYIGWWRIYLDNKTEPEKYMKMQHISTGRYPDLELRQYMTVRNVRCYALNSELIIEASTVAAGVTHNFTAITDLLTDWLDSYRVTLLILIAPLSCSVVPLVGIWLLGHTDVFLKRSKGADYSLKLKIFHTVYGI